MSKIVDGIAKDLKSVPEKLKAKTGNIDKKKLILMNLPYILTGYFCDKIAWLWRVSPGCHSANYLEAFSSVYLETNSGSNSVMGILNCCCPAK